MKEVRLLVSYLNVESICWIGSKVWVAKKFLEERKLILSVIIFVSRDRGKGSPPNTGCRDNYLEEKIKSDHFSP